MTLIKIVLVIIVLLIIVIGYKVYLFLYKPVNVELTEISQITTEKDLGNGGYWSVIYDNEHSAIKQFNMTLPEVDFNKYSLIFSTGRELKQLTYKRGVTLPYGKDVYKGYPVFGKSLNPHTIFIYRIGKIKINEDDFSAPEDIVIED